MIITIENNIKEAIQEIFKEDKFTSASGIDYLKYFNGFIPKKKIEDEKEDFPLILIRFNTDKYALNQGIVNTELEFYILIGTYGEENFSQAYHEAIEIYERIKTKIVETGRLGDYFMHRDTIQGLLNPEQADPYIWFQMNITVKVPYVNTKLEEEFI